MFTEKKTKTTLSKALALGMVATSVSLAGQTTTADAAKNENTDTTSLYKTQTISSKTGTVTASSLNIRKGPPTSYSIVGALKNGQSVTITDTDSATGWYKIKTSAGVVGYASNKYIKVDGQVSENTGSNNTTTATAKKTATVTASSLNVRSGPSTAYSIVTTLSRGHNVTIHETASTGWHKVTTATGKTGYVSPTYVKVTGSTNSGTTNNNTNTNTNIQSGVYVVQSYSTITKVGKVNATSLNVRSALQEF